MSVERVCVWEDRQVGYLRRTRLLGIVGRLRQIRGDKLALVGPRIRIEDMEGR